MPSAVVANGFADISAIAASTSRNVAVVAERSGRLTLLDLLRQADGLYDTRVIGEGYDAPRHLAIDDARGTLVIADADGLWLARLNNANRDAATPFASAPGEVLGLGVVAGAPTASLAVLDGKPSPHLVSYSLGTPPGDSVSDLLPPAPGASGLAVSADGRSAVLLAASGAGPVLQLGDFDAGTLTQLTPQPLPFGGRVLTLAPGWVLVAGPGGQLAAVRDDGVVRILPPDALGSSVLDAAVSGPASVLRAVGGDVVETRLPTGLTEPVLLTMDPAPLFVGAYAPVHVDTAGSGLAFDDLELTVKDAALGAVSPSRDETFDPDHPHLLLTAGWRTGTGTVVARNRTTGEAVGRASFDVTDTWADPDEGPAYAVTGRCEAPVVRSAWGGGDAGPQNVDIYKAPAAWRVGIVLIDTTTRPYPGASGGLNTMRTNWSDAFSGGVTVGGVTRSVSGFWSQVSYGRLTMSLVGAKIAGPVHALGTWEDYFEVENKNDLPDRWNPKPDTWKSFVSSLEQANAVASAAGDPLVLDLAQTDAVVFVVRTANRPFVVDPPTSTSIGRFVWPQQSTQTVKLNGSDRTLPMVMMPEDWTAIDGRQVYATLAHELGHSLQLPDLYLYDWMNQGNAQRQLDRWDLMDADGGLPELSLPFRMALGWVAKGEVRAFNFAANGGVPILETVTLQALGRNPLPANGVRGVEVRIAQGRNYYFEYRNPQGTPMGDGSLPLGQVVMGVDVVSPKGPQNYDNRPMTLRLYDDPDHVDDTDGVLTEGAFLSPGHDYRERDFSEGAPKDFVATVLAVRPDSADLQIRYDSEAKPELSIRTWPNGDHQWQSPDIQVRNAKSDADPRWLNVPWGGNPNRVVATVKNHGGLEARDVRGYFSVKNLTTNADDQPPAALEPLGLSGPVTIPAGQTRELEVQWVAPEGGHYCVTVDIPLYEDPGDPAVHESSDRDNFAQSNYDQFWSESGSPSARKRFTVILANPTDAATVVFPRVRQTSPFYRTYLEHSWLRLGPKQERTIGVMTESLDGDPAWAAFVDRNRGVMWETPNLLEVSGWVHAVCAPQCTGGVSLAVHSGRRTRFEDLRFYPEPGAAGVVRASDGTPANNGQVLMTAWREGEDPAKRLTASADVQNDGGFFVYHAQLERGMVATLHYLGGYGFAPVDTGRLDVEW